MNEYVYKIVATQQINNLGETEKFYGAVGVVAKDVVDGGLKLKRELEEQGMIDIIFNDISKL